MLRSKLLPDDLDPDAGAVRIRSGQAIDTRFEPGQEFLKLSNTRIRLRHQERLLELFSLRAGPAFRRGSYFGSMLRALCSGLSLLSKLHLQRHQFESTAHNLVNKALQLLPSALPDLLC